MLPAFHLRAYNETLSIIAMCVCNEDCSPARIHGCNAAPTPSGFAEIVSDDFPVLHGGRIQPVLAPQAMTK
jgi:hypothetical protein